MSNATYIPSVETLARRHTERAIETLADVMNRGLEDKDRIKAAEALLDRGHGRPTSVSIQVPASKRQAERLASMTNEQLMQVIEQTEIPAEFHVEPLALDAPAEPDEFEALLA